VIVRSVLADNAGPLTLDGTRTYVVGRGAVVIIDPGPRDPEHLERVRLAVDRRPVSAIFVTHSHSDHVAGAAGAAALFGAPIRASAETLRRAGLAGVELIDGDRTSWDGGRELIAIHTPGHCRDHFSFLLPPDREVFTGDLVLGAGTSVILYPDGSLADYLASLARLAALRPGRLWPGHGEPVADGAAKLSEYRRHRLDRSRQILEAVAAGARSVTDIREIVYADLPRALEPAAEASISAHLDHLRAAGEDVPTPDPGFRFTEKEG
jgi:glyoxylase-like metal-dependent hydrolase (beta-lactamase superfamily II)